MTYGIDFSRGGFVRPATIIASGRPVVGRYGVGDLSPEGRGITAAEYASYADHKIDSFLYWEGRASWMLGGFDAGVEAARDFEQNLAAAGEPDGLPGYFAHDIDPVPSHFPAIEACVRGINSVVGPDRTALYGGWLLIDHFARLGNVKYFAQTLAWEYGRGVHPAAHIYQYGFDAWFDNVNCDLIVTLKENYGQASKFVTPPVVIPPPVVYPAVKFPDWFARAEARRNPSSAVDADGNTWYPQRLRAQALDETLPHIAPDVHSPAAGPHIPKGAKINVDWAFALEDEKGNEWFANPMGYWRASTFTPVIPLPHARRAKKAA